MGEIKYVHMTRARADDDPHADTGVTALYFIGTVPRSPYPSPRHDARGDTRELARALSKSALSSTDTSARQPERAVYRTL